MKRNKAISVDDAVGVFERDFFTIALSADTRQNLAEHLKNLLGSDKLDYRAKHLEDPLRELFHKMLSLPEYQMG